MRVERLGTANAVAIGVAIALATLPGPAIAVHLDYAVDAGVERNDNVAMSAVDPFVEDSFRAGMGFALTHDTSAIQTSITGRAEYRDYLSDTFADTFEGTLAGRFNWFAVPERLSFTVEDSLMLQAVNTFVPDSPGNRQQVNVLSVGPNLYFNLPAQLRGQAELRYSSADAEITDDFNSQRQSLALRAVKELSTTSQVSLNLQGQRIDFDDDSVARDYTRYDVFGRFARDLAHFALGLDAGYSRLSYGSGDGDLSEPLLRANVDWLPNRRHRLSMAASRQFSDAATDALVGIGGDTTTMPGPLLVGDAVVNTSPFEERRLSLGYTFTGSRLQLLVEPYINRLDYVDADEFDQDGHGVIFSTTWELRPRLFIGAFTTFDHVDYLQLGVEHETRRYGFHMQHDWSRHWGSRIEWARHDRRSSVPGDDASQDTFYLSIIYRR
jgi:hypothetical protein